MPLYNTGSYVPTMEEFLAHWAAVNTELGAPPAPELMLAGGYTRANFDTDQDAIAAAITEVENLENGLQTAGAARDIQKAALREKLGQFRASLRALFPGTKYPRAAPTMPQFGSAESKFLAAFDDMLNLWTRINADATLPGFTPPLVIGGYAIATYTTDLAALRTAFAAVNEAVNDLDVGQKSRDVLLKPARERMVQYRNAVEAAFGPSHALTLSLPDVYPAPGHTPDPVTLSGSWNMATSQADLNWTTSADPDFDEYEVRFSPGPTYNAATATVIANLPQTANFLQTTSGLANPSDTASYKVFVVLTTANEAGSNTVSVTRP